MRDAQYQTCLRQILIT